MNDFLDKVRFIDFDFYYRLYWLGLNNHYWSRTFFIFAKYGIVLAFLSFTYLVWTKRINAFICSFLAMGIAGLTDFLITIFWQRPRPFVSHTDLVTPITEGLRVDTNSFPSAHTYIVFAIAVSILLYGHKKLGTVLLILAVCTALGRVGAGLHYPSDIFGGALLGVASGWAAYQIVRRYEDNWNA